MELLFQSAGAAYRVFHELLAGRTPTGAGDDDQRLDLGVVTAILRKVEARFLSPKERARPRHRRDCARLRRSLSIFRPQEVVRGRGIVTTHSGRLGHRDVGTRDVCRDIGVCDAPVRAVGDVGCCAGRLVKRDLSECDVIERELHVVTGAFAEVGDGVCATSVGHQQPAAAGIRASRLHDETCAARVIPRVDILERVRARGRRCAVRFPDLCLKEIVGRAVRGSAVDPGGTIGILVHLPITLGRIEAVTVARGATCSTRPARVAAGAARRSGATTRATHASLASRAGRTSRPGLTGRTTRRARSSRATRSANASVVAA